MLRRAGLVGLLIYVTLDLSLPAMPGAFVFEAESSVESVHSGRGRVVTGLDTVPHQDADRRGEFSSIRVDLAAPARMLTPAPPPRRAHRLPRAMLPVTTIVSASPLEDPH